MPFCSNHRALLAALMLTCIFGLYVSTSTTVHWHGPILSGGGYASEALDFLHAAHEREINIQVHQHGDSQNAEYIHKLLSQENLRLITQLSLPSFSSDGNDLAEDAEIAIMVCHSEPGAWHAPQPHYHTATACPPHPSLYTDPGSSSMSAYRHSLNEHKRIVPYTVGRTMFETNRIPSGWVSRLNFMDEVWVPTSFAKAVFVKEGVEEAKVRVVPEPVDTGLYRPVDLEALAYGDGADDAAQSGGNDSGNIENAEVVPAPDGNAEGISSSAKLRFDELSPAIKSLVSIKYPPRDTVLQPEQVSASTTRTVRTIATTAPTLFLFVGKWELRKGIRHLLLSYITEFASQDDDVLLLILSSGYHSTESTSKKLFTMLRDEIVYQRTMLTRPPEHRAPDTVDFTAMNGLPEKLEEFDLARDVFPRIRIIESIPQAEMAVLYNLVDAVVIPSYGEGWGRPHVEALASGTPVIATNWSGVTAYLTEDNGYPITIAKELAKSRDWKGHSWAFPNINSIRGHMRSVHANKTEAKRRGAQGRLDMVRQYSFSAMGEILQREVDRIEDKIFPERREKRDASRVLSVQGKSPPLPPKPKKARARRRVAADDLEL